jgi:hypothetical protein
MLYSAWLPELGRTGDSLVDASGRYINGVLTSMDPPNDWVIGRHGWSLATDGSNDRVDVGPNTWDNSPMSIVQWFLANNVATESRTFSRGTASGNNPSIQIFSSSIRGIMGNGDDGGSGQVIGSATSISSATWYQAALVVDKVRMKFYLDGVLKTDDAAAESINSTSENMLIGARTNGTTSNHGGIIGSTLIYNRALTAAEVSQLYVDPFAAFRTRVSPALFVPAAAPAGGVTAGSLGLMGVGI